RHFALAEAARAWAIWVVSIIRLYSNAVFIGRALHKFSRYHREKIDFVPWSGKSGTANAITTQPSQPRATHHDTCTESGFRQISFQREDHCTFLQQTSACRLSRANRIQVTVAWTQSEIY